ncbi:MAG: hypothetical protein ACNA7V_09380 [Bacteroidales bacterium]
MKRLNGILKKITIRKWIKKLIFKIRLNLAIREAKQNARLFDRRFMVIEFAGVPKVFSKRQLKEAVARGFFKKGTTVQRLEQMAWFITDGRHQPKSKS